MGNVYNGLLQRNPNRQRANMLQKILLGLKENHGLQNFPFGGGGVGVGLGVWR